MLGRRRVFRAVVIVLAPILALSWLVGEAVSQGGNGLPPANLVSVSQAPPWYNNGTAPQEESNGTSSEELPAGKSWPLMTAPPPFPAPSMAYDASRGVTVLYAGQLTWEYDGAAWYPLTTAHVPQVDMGTVMTYDPFRGVTVLGGLRDNYYGETWEYDGIDWKKVTPATHSYPKRVYGAMTYDDTRERTVFFGGIQCQHLTCAYFDETWEYDGFAWAKVTALHAPPARARHAMAYDAARGVTVLFGGSVVLPKGEGQVFSDTWEYDGTDWHIITLTRRPPARSRAAMVYDSDREVIVLFGGYNEEGTPLNDTWEYDGIDWQQVTPTLSPPARVGHAMAYDQAQGKIVLFGGHSPEAGQPFGDTWEYDGSSWNLAVEQATQQPTEVPYPYCPTERPPGAGTFYIMPFTDIGQNERSNCGSGDTDWYTLCCDCNGPTDCPLTCWQEGGNQDLIELDEMKNLLGAQFNNANVKVGFSDTIFYMGWVDNDEYMHFNENILRYIIAVAIASNTHFVLHLNGQQWAGSGWPGYGQLTRSLLEIDEANMHVNYHDPGGPPQPWYDGNRDPTQHISSSDIDLTIPNLNWILHREFQYYKERNLKEGLCWLNNFRTGDSGHLLVGISTDSEIGMSSLYAAHPNLEMYAGTCEGGVPCNYNPWDDPLLGTLQVAFDYEDQFDYRQQYQDECVGDPIPPGNFHYCTGGMRHHFCDVMYEEYGGDIGAFNAAMGSSLGGWWADPHYDSSDHFLDGYSVQNNPPVCQYSAGGGHADWECVFLPQPGSYNQNYIDAWITYREETVQNWVQPVCVNDFWTTPSGI